MGECAKETCPGSRQQQRQPQRRTSSLPRFCRPIMCTEASSGMRRVSACVLKLLTCIAWPRRRERRTARHATAARQMRRQPQGMVRAPCRCCSAAACEQALCSARKTADRQFSLKASSAPTSIMVPSVYTWQTGKERPTMMQRANKRLTCRAGRWREERHGCGAAWRGVQQAPRRAASAVDHTPCISWPCTNAG